MQIAKPLEKAWPITQRFETKVKYMRSGIHSGIDWACPKGTELLGCFDGVVAKTENVLINSGYGRAIWIRSKENPKLVALYGHTSKILATVGTEVLTGQIIALSGNSGYVFSTSGGDGSHLHFALLLDGIFIDPMPLLSEQTPSVIKIDSDIHIPVKDGDSKQFEDYIVKKGDTLYGIAIKKLKNAQRWKELAEINKDVVRNPKKIIPGMKLRIPTL